MPVPLMRPRQNILRCLTTRRLRSVNAASVSLNPFRLSERRWRIAWLLALGVLDQLLRPRQPVRLPRRADIATFGISNIAFGYLSGAYNWTYALCQLPIGVLLDRFGIRRIGRISTFIWSIASFGAAVTPSLGGFFAARFLLGVGEAPTFPSQLQGHRPLVSRPGNAASPPPSTILPPSSQPPLACLSSGSSCIHVGWRWSFATTGFISFAYCVVFWRVYRDPAEDLN
jgi:ACS family D-galactonate transporter-like MFS transporter